jgi:hypothetical protein
VKGKEGSITFRSQTRSREPHIRDVRRALVTREGRPGSLARAHQTATQNANIGSPPRPLSSNPRRYHTRDADLASGVRKTSTVRSSELTTAKQHTRSQPPTACITSAAHPLLTRSTGSPPHDIAGERQPPCLFLFLVSLSRLHPPSSTPSGPLGRDAIVPIHSTTPSSPPPRGHSLAPYSGAPK